MQQPLATPQQQPLAMTPQQPLGTPQQQPLGTPQQQGYQPLDKESMRGSAPSKGPSPVVLLLLLSLIPVMFCVALGIRYMTRGPRVVHSIDEHKTTPSVDGATTPHPTAVHPTAAHPTAAHPTAAHPTAAHPTAAHPTAAHPTAAHPTAAHPTTFHPTNANPTTNHIISHPTTPHVNPVQPTDLTVPYTPNKGTEQYTGVLPTDLEPVHYSVVIVLNGTSLADPKLKWNGKAEALLKVAKATPKVILKGDPGTIKDLKMALLDDGKPAKGMNITTLSVSTTFLIAQLDKPLEVGKTYTLLTEYELDKSAPIAATADFVKMQLKKDSAFQAFPSFEKTGWNVPITLTLYTPPNLVTVSNAPQDGPATTDKTFSVQKFKPTLPMPPDMLAWSAFSNTTKSFEAVPNKVNLYMKAQNADLQKAAKTAFEFLSKYFEDPAHQHVAKIDIVFSKPADAQDSLGLIILDEATKPDDICEKMASQWTNVLTQPPATEPWLAAAGVKYLCLLAGTEESHLAPALMKHFMDCMKPTPSPGTRELLVFRMAHIILGDAAFQKAIQNYVTKNMFNSTTTDADHGAFAPLVPKEYVAKWLKESFAVKKLERNFTASKTMTWKNADATSTPFANSDKGTISLRTPAAVVVEWLNNSKASFPVTATDKTALYVNPSMMACYGVELDSKSWALIGHDMEVKAPDVINGWYLLGQAAKQFKSIEAPHDFTGFMWMWAVLKTGDKDLWDDHVQQFIDTEKQAYSMITKVDAAEKYKKRVEAVIKTGLINVTSANITAANKGKTPVLLANLVCQMGMPECGILLPSTINQSGEINKTFTTEPLDAVAVACYLGSAVKSQADFDKLKLPTSPPTGTEATLPVRLAFCGCVNATLARSLNIEPQIRSVYQEALHHAWVASEAVALRSPQGLREAALTILTSHSATPAQQTTDQYKEVLKSAVALKLFFNTTEIAMVKTNATSNHVPPDDPDLKALEQAVVPDKPPLLDWIYYPDAAP